MEDLLIPLVAILSVFVFAPMILFHYITLWRRQKTLQPDDERIMEDLWRSAKAMERRIDTLEALLDAKDTARGNDLPPRGPRAPYEN